MGRTHQRRVRAFEHQVVAIAGQAALVGAGNLVAHAVEADALGDAAAHVVQEQVIGVVAVAGHQVAGCGLEQHQLTVRGNVEEIRTAIALDANRAHRYALDRTGVHVLHEHIALAVGVVRHQVGGVRLEGDIHATVGNTCLVTAAIRLDAIEIGGHAIHGFGLRIKAEDVEFAIAVAGNQVGGARTEHHEAASSRHAPIAGGSVGGQAIRATTGQQHVAGLTIHDVQLGRRDAAIRDQVVGAGKGHIATTRADRHGECAVRVLLAIREVVQALHLPAAVVANEHITLAVAITRHQLRGFGGEHRMAAIAVDTAFIRTTESLRAVHQRVFRRGQQQQVRWRWRYCGTGQRGRAGTGCDQGEKAGTDAGGSRHAALPGSRISLRG